ncbi:hypothetical protein [Jannaschia sp. W003]|uniref:hypothetical protein n=1 Tax=Jannaschia sp. W003 TaxID=2867012 RepID=UPI0021A29A16|nr:hypothetical protein [Jannaschia sp. W003]UWQ20254.1 hypothetical protein K3554_09610 [Jannaschia sp. W003]
MRRWHFYLMGAIATIWGILSLAEYTMVSYGLQAGWLDMYPPQQLEWLATLPGWVHGVWGAHATLALVGALCLVAHVRAAVWMLGLSWVGIVVLALWSHVFAAPPLWSISGGMLSVGVTLLVVALSGLIWLYARGEKRHGDML